jgi:hypothetical protein
MPADLFQQGGFVHGLDDDPHGAQGALPSPSGGESSTRPTPAFLASTQKIGQGF